MGANLIKILNPKKMVLHLLSQKSLGVSINVITFFAYFWTPTTLYRHFRWPPTPSRHRHFLDLFLWFAKKYLLLEMGLFCDLQIKVFYLFCKLTFFAICKKKVLFVICKKRYLFLLFAKKVLFWKWRHFSRPSPHVTLASYLLNPPPKGWRHLQPLRKS